MIVKPWGWYRDIERKRNYVVKELFIRSGESISLQYHNLRKEWWHVLSGDGELFTAKNINDPIVHCYVKTGDTISIDLKQIHRVTAKIGSDLRILEVQYGKCREDDIVRLDDFYGRT